MKMLDAQRGNSRPDAAITAPAIVHARSSSALLLGPVLALGGNLLLRCP